MQLTDYMVSFELYRRRNDLGEFFEENLFWAEVCKVTGDYLRLSDAEELDFLNAIRGKCVEYYDAIQDGSWMRESFSPYEASDLSSKEACLVYLFAYKALCAYAAQDAYEQDAIRHFFPRPLLEATHSRLSDFQISDIAKAVKRNPILNGSYPFDWAPQPEVPEKIATEVLEKLTQGYTLFEEMLYFIYLYADRAERESLYHIMYKEYQRLHPQNPRIRMWDRLKTAVEIAPLYKKIFFEPLKVPMPEEMKSLLDAKRQQAKSGKTDEELLCDAIQRMLDDKELKAAVEESDKRGWFPSNRSWKGVYVAYIDFLRVSHQWKSDYYKYPSASEMARIIQGRFPDMVQKEKSLNQEIAPSRSKDVFDDCYIKWNKEGFFEERKFNIQNITNKKHRLIYEYIFCQLCPDFA